MGAISRRCDGSESRRSVEELAESVSGGHGDDEHGGPTECIETVGLASDGRRTHLLADSRWVATNIAVAKVEFMDDCGGKTAVTGEPNSEPILGLTALESMDVEMGVARQELRKLPAVRLRPIRRLPRTAGATGCLPKG